MTQRTRQNLVRRKCMLSQTYILYFYISTGNLILNLLLFQEASLHFFLFFIFFPCFTGFPDLPNIYFTREKIKKKREVLEKALGFKESSLLGLDWAVSFSFDVLIFCHYLSWLFLFTICSCRDVFRTQSNI